MILLACLKSEDKDNFRERIHIVKNIVINSDNELRHESIGDSFREITKFVNSGYFDDLVNFKTSQIEEERFKSQFYGTLDKNETIKLFKLDNSNVFRGSLNIIILESNSFSRYADELLSLFEETKRFEDNLEIFVKALLCFGDFTQTHNGYTNMLSKNSTLYRKFLTHNGFDKVDFIDKTKVVLYKLLEYRNLHPLVSLEEIIQNSITNYEVKPKDWIYYFITYPSFRWFMNKGYYYWYDKQYSLSKMKEMYFNGYNWDPFLHEFIYLEFENIELINYQGKLEVTLNTELINISTLSNGFLFANVSPENLENKILNQLVAEGVLNSDCILVIQQNDYQLDLEDRIEKLKSVLYGLRSNN